VDTPTILLPKELAAFVEFMRSIRAYHGGNSELVERFRAYSGETISAKSLKQLMNKWRCQLEEQGICFRSHRSNGQRYISVSYGAPAEAQQSGFGGERTSDGADELSSLRGSEGVQFARTRCRK